MIGETPTVWVHPGRYHGEPCIEGHRIPTRMVAEHVYYGTGDSAEFTWDITRDEVMVACWFEAKYGSRKLRRHWAEWLDAHAGLFWHSRDWDQIPYPPSVAAAVPA